MQTRACPQLAQLLLVGIAVASFACRIAPDEHQQSCHSVHSIILRFTGITTVRKVLTHEPRHLMPQPLQVAATSTIALKISHCADGQRDAPAVAPP